MGTSLLAAASSQVYYLYTEVPGMQIGYWGRVGNVTGKSQARTQSACAVVPPGSMRATGGKTANADAHAILAHAGFGAALVDSSADKASGQSSADCGSGMV